MIHDAPIADITDFIAKEEGLALTQFHFVKAVDPFKYEFSDHGKKEFYYIHNIDETAKYIKYLFNSDRYDMIGIAIAAMQTKAQKALYALLSPKYKTQFPKYKDFNEHVDPLWAFTASQAAPVIKPIVSDIGLDDFATFLADYIDTKTYEKHTIANDLKKPKKKSVKNIMVAFYFDPR
jgi:hypothetical protein